MARKFHECVFGNPLWEWVVDASHLGHYLRRNFLRVFLIEEVKAEVFGANHKPKALGRHEVVGVHLILSVCLIPLDFFEIVDDTHIYL